MVFSGNWVNKTVLNVTFPFHFNEDQTVPGETAEYTPNIPIASRHEVSIFYVQDSNRSTATEHQITHAHGTTSVFVNQRINGSQWNSIGTYTFNQGTGGSVTIITDSATKPDVDAVFGL